MVMRPAAGLGGRSPQGFAREPNAPRCRSGGFGETAGRCGVSILQSTSCAMRATHYAWQCLGTRSVTVGHTNETLRRSGGGSRVARIPHSTKGLHVLVVTCQDWFLGVAIWGPLLQGLVLSP